MRLLDFLWCWWHNICPKHLKQMKDTGYEFTNYTCEDCLADYRVAERDLAEFRELQKRVRLNDIRRRRASR